MLIWVLLTFFQRLRILKYFQKYFFQVAAPCNTAGGEVCCACTARWCLFCALTFSGKVFTKSKRKPGPVAMLSSLMSSVVEEMTSSPASSQSSVTSLDDMVAPGDDESDTTDYVFRIVYTPRPDYVGEFHNTTPMGRITSPIRLQLVNLVPPFLPYLEANYATVR